MLIHPHTLSIITTHQCTAACDHCCFDCTPQKKNSIPVPHIHEYIEQATEISTLSLVVFTGGECFMLGKDLDECVATAARNGFMARFVSNGYWAISPRVARQRLQRLVDHGLREANFSTGDAHMKYVRPEYVINGAVAAAEMGMPVSVMIELRPGSDFDLDGFTNHPELKPLLEQHRVSLHYSPWMRFSGQDEIQYPQEMVDNYNRAQSDTGCGTIMKVIAINPDEHLIACCGLTFEEIPDLHLGSLRERSVGQILRETKDDFVKIWIHLQGPQAVLDYARKFDPSIPDNLNMAHMCETCRFIYQDQRVVDAVTQNPPPNRKDLVQEYMMSLMRPQYRENNDLLAEYYMNSCSVDQAETMRELATS